MNIPIDSMTNAEKIEAMEQLWASLQHNREPLNPSLGSNPLIDPS